MQYYTPSKGANDKNRKQSNQKFFNSKFFKSLQLQEKELRQNVNKYPELKEYRNGGNRLRKKIPSWAAFSYLSLE